jgi:hypothetical protein
MQQHTVPASLERRKEDVLLMTGRTHLVHEVHLPGGRPAPLHMAVVRSPSANRLARGLLSRRPTCNGYVAYPFHNQQVTGHPANCSATSVGLTNLMQASVFHHRAPFAMLLLATSGKTPNRRCCTFSGSRLVDELGQPLRPSERRSSATYAALHALSRLRAAQQHVHRSDASSRCVFPARGRLTGGAASTRWEWIHL